MEPDTKSDVASKEETKIPFVLQGLGFFLINEDEVDSEFGKERKNPRDISYLSKTSYRYLAHPFPVDFDNSEEPNNDSTQQTDLQSHQATVSPGAHSLPLGEEVELPDEEYITHYNRLLGGDFPWERLNTLAHAGLERNDMDAVDLGG